MISKFAGVSGSNSNPAGVIVAGTGVKVESGFLLAILCIFKRNGYQTKRLFGFGLMRFLITSSVLFDSLSVIVFLVRKYSSSSRFFVTLQEVNMVGITRINDIFAKKCFNRFIRN